MVSLEGPVHCSAKGPKSIGARHNFLNVTPAYINHTKAPKWLSRECIYEMLGNHQKYRGYRTYVEAGVDDEIKEFYHRGHTAAVIGDQEFITWVRESQLQEVADTVWVTQI